MHHDDWLVDLFDALAVASLAAPLGWWLGYLAGGYGLSGEQLYGVALTSVLVIALSHAGKWILH